LSANISFFFFNATLSGEQFIFFAEPDQVTVGDLSGETSVRRTGSVRKATPEPGAGQMVSWCDAFH